MSQIIKKSVRREIVEHFAVYTDLDCKGAGYSFPCDASGNIALDEMEPAGIENYHLCRLREINVEYKGIETYKRSWVDPAMLQCDCGEKVELYDPLDNVCNCGAIYNMSGQRVRCLSTEADEPYWPEF